MSTGGDELNVNCFTQDPQSQQLLNSTGKTFEQALDTFTQATHQVLEKHGKTPVVWEGGHQTQIFINSVDDVGRCHRDGLKQ